MMHSSVSNTHTHTHTLRMDQERVAKVVQVTLVDDLSTSLEPGRRTELNTGVFGQVSGVK